MKTLVAGWRVALAAALTADGTELRRRYDALRAVLPPPPASYVSAAEWDSQVQELVILSLFARPLTRALFGARADQHEITRRIDAVLLAFRETLPDGPPTT